MSPFVKNVCLAKIPVVSLTLTNTLDKNRPPVSKLGFPANETFRDKMQKFSLKMRNFRAMIFPFRWKP